MRGNLRDMAVADLIQHTCQDGKTAHLRIQHENQQADLYFKEGNVEHAVLGAWRGEEAVYQVLRWELGEFSLETGVASPQHTIDRSWAGLLMEGMRRLDEAQVQDNFEDSLQLEEVNSMAGELDSLLKNLSKEVDGFVAAAVVGMDGLGIAGYTEGTLDTEAINAQMTLLFKLVTTTADKLLSDSVEDFLLTTERAYVLVRYLSDTKFYLGITADRRQANLGNLRLISRIYAERLSKAMPR
jgi:predicted regulator of Ras-like GTPase activity (Roadblock/LC7/MglB family)